MIRDKRRYLTIMPSRPVFDSEERGSFEASFYSALLVQLGEAEYFKANPKIMKFVGTDRIHPPGLAGKVREVDSGRNVHQKHGREAHRLLHDEGLRDHKGAAKEERGKNIGP